MKNLIWRIHTDAEEENYRMILGLTEYNPHARILDLGGGHGTFTKKLGAAIGSKFLYGIDIEPSRVAACEKIGIVACYGDLNDGFPGFPDDWFDVIHANQVFEHLHATDEFLREIHRVLKPSGYVILSVPNIAAWHNIAFLIAGQQPLCAGLSDEIVELGNIIHTDYGNNYQYEHPGHLRLPTIRGIQGLLEHHRFKVTDMRGVGYYPLSGIVARIMTRVDKHHAVYITLKAVKA